ncbi:MAG TPA: Wzz/FepE/Etk N-terminal domain-containing protein [Rubrobacteraceae bacterium]|nr:Wzz/FepE/Etk N-terminal domain-containing protein [Rubrobacteraceae bacterium]
MRSINRIGRQGWQRARRNDLALPEILHVLWGWRRLISIIVLSLLIVGLTFALLRERAYTAEAIVLVEPQQEVPAEDMEPFLRDVTGAVTSSEDFIVDVRRKAGWKGTPEEFARRLDVQSLVTSDGTPTIRVRFESVDAEEAARTANAYAALFTERVDLLNDRQLAGGALAADARVASKASLPDRPSGAGPLFYVAGAIVAGMLIGGGMALLLENRARSWRDARDAELTLRAPVLGVIPEYPSAEEV